MKIVFAADTYPPHVNGAAIATYRLITGLNKRGHNIFVLAPSNSIHYSVGQEGPATVYRLRSILIQKAQAFRVSPPILHDAQIREIISGISPDVIHVINPGFIARSVMRVGEKLKIPMVGTIHFMPDNLVHYLKLPGKIEDVLNSFVWKQYAKLYSKLDMLIAPTATARDILIRVDSKLSIVVISNGIDLTRFTPQKNGKELKEKFYLPDKPILLYLGRVDKEKKLDIFLRAAAILKNTTMFHIVIAGKGKELPRLKQLTGELGLSDHTTFVGVFTDDDLPKIYKLAKIFVIPSIAELQSLVTMEAMATGLPVVGANAVALPHLIHDNQNGFLFEPGNFKELADKLRMLLMDEKLRADMGEKSLEIIREHGMENVVSQVEKVYNTVIENHKKSLT